MNRRKFLSTSLSGVAGLLSIASPVCGLAASGSASAVLSDLWGCEKLSGETFRKHLNTVFRLRDAGGMRHDALLAEVASLPAQEHLDQFTLRFNVAGGEKLEEGCYFVEHPALGDFDLFLNSRAGEAGLYEAPFSLLA